MMFENSTDQISSNFQEFLGGGLIQSLGNYDVEDVAWGNCEARKWNLD